MKKDANETSEEAIHGGADVDSDVDPSADAGSGPDGHSASDTDTDSEDVIHGRMAERRANPNPQPGDPAFPGADDTRPTPQLLREPHRWMRDPMAMVTEIEKHIRESHGLEPDKALLREVVAFIHDMLDHEPQL